MVKKIILTLILMLSATLHAATPDAEHVNKIILMALNADEAKLNDKAGGYKCTDSSGLSVKGQNHDLAYAKIFLLCIRKQCGEVQAKVNAKIDEMRNMNPDDRADLLAALGGAAYASVVEKSLAQGSYGGTTSCLSSQTARFLAYDQCYFGPYMCTNE